MEVFKVVKVTHKADAEPTFTPCHRTGSGLLGEVMKWVKPEKRKYLCRCQGVGVWLLLPWEAVEVVAKYKWAISWPADAEINPEGRRPGCTASIVKLQQTGRAAESGQALLSSPITAAPMLVFTLVDISGLCV